MYVQPEMRLALFLYVRDHWPPRHGRSLAGQMGLQLDFESIRVRGRRTGGKVSRTESGMGAAERVHPT